MVKNFISYVLTVIFFSIIVSLLMNMVLGFLPYVGVALVLFVPVYGTIRKLKHWKSKSSGVKTWLIKLRHIVAFNRKTMIFYLVFGITFGFLFKQIVWMVAETTLISAGALLSFYLGWEGVRWGLRKWKSITILSFGQALKSGW
jgi:hypothetical protein